MKAFVSTYPFCSYSKKPLEILEEYNIQCDVNPLNRKMTTEELEEHYNGQEILIAGTEVISEKIIKSGSLKLISRVGIGLDSVNLALCREYGVEVCYTPDAPSPAVAELTIGLIYDCLRKISLSNYKVHNGEWKRYFGRRITDVTIGIIGCGRIGTRVIDTLIRLGVKNIMACDVDSDKVPSLVKTSNKYEILKNCDVVSIHIPLTEKNFYYINSDELSIMKKDAILINTSRGGIINESALAEHLNSHSDFLCACDVFKVEPYFGELTKHDNCIITGHMGSMTIDCRTNMELEAVQSSVKYFYGNGATIVPEFEYGMQKNE